MVEKLSSEEHLEAIWAVLPDPTRGQTPLGPRNTSLAQVRNMAHFSGITLTPKQEYLYLVLRELPVATEEGLTSPVLRSFVTLSDQRLLETVLWLTGNLKERGVFMSAYPNIFEPNGVVEHQT